MSAKLVVRAKVISKKAIRAELCRLAIGLGRSLNDAYPREPEVLGLLALMVLHEARRPARLEGG